MTPAELSPLGGMASSMRAYQIHFHAIDAKGEKRPSSITVWALGASLAILLAERQLETAAIKTTGELTWSECPRG